MDEYAVVQVRTNRKGVRLVEGIVVEGLDEAHDLLRVLLAGPADRAWVLSLNALDNTEDDTHTAIRSMASTEVSR